MAIVQYDAVKLAFTDQITITTGVGDPGVAVRVVVNETTGATAAATKAAAIQLLEAVIARLTEENFPH